MLVEHGALLVKGQSEGGEAVLKLRISHVPVLWF